MKVWKSMGASLLVLTLIMPGTHAEQITLNFRDTDIRAVIESVAEITGRSFVLDPRVQGTVSMFSPAPVESENLLEMLQSALQVQGFQAMDDGQVIRVIPLNAAFRSAGRGGSTMVTEVISLHHAKAGDVATLIKGMLSNGAVVRGFDDGNYLVVTDTAAQLQRLRGVLAEIDNAGDNAVEVIQLTYIDAGEALYLAGQLDHLNETGLSIVEDRHNNRLVVGGNARLREELRRFLKAVDQPTPSFSSIEVVVLKYADALAVKTILEQFLQGSNSGVSGAENSASKMNYSIQADEDANAVLISAPRALTLQLKQAIAQIDQPRQQVLIEGVLAEISQDQAARLSAQVAVLGKDTGGALVRFDNLIPALLGVKVANDNDELGQAGVAVAFSQLENGFVGGAGTTWNDGENGIGVLIQALKSDANTNILSTPSLVTLNNEEAVITVGQEVPFITGSYTSNTNDVGNPFQTIQREEVGVKLRVVPRINDLGSVQLQIEQEASNLLATARQAGTADVVTAKRSILTNVAVNDGQFLVLGGLIDETTSNDDQRVPLLGDIPLLGRLFRSDSRAENSRVLMMFIRPTVLGTVADADAVSRARYQHLRQAQINSLDDKQRDQGRALPENPEDLIPAGKSVE